MKSKRPGDEGLRVHDIDMPRATGFSNETIFFSASWNEDGSEKTERYVARIEPVDAGIFPIQTPPCEVSAGLQHKIMEVIAATGVVPMPPMGAYEADPSVLGSPFFVMGFVDGVIPADAPRYSTDGFLVDEAKPADRERMVRSGIDSMVAINQLDWRKEDLAWLDVSGTGEPTLQMQIDLYREYTLRELDGLEHPVMMQALDWLEQNAPNDAPMALSWGDARLGNIIWQNYECAAVCDWEACAISPPEADIGWWVMFDRMSFDDMGVDRLEGFPTREKMVAMWEAGMGREVAGGILYWEIFAVMRFCAIFVKLSGRFEKAGFQTPETSTRVNNGVTDSLAKLLEMAT